MESSDSDKVTPNQAIVIGAVMIVTFIVLQATGVNDSIMEFFRGTDEVYDQSGKRWHGTGGPGLAIIPGFIIYFLMGFGGHITLIVGIVGRIRGKRYI